MTITINGHEDVEPGCYIAGHHGQYGLDMLGDVVEQFGYEFEPDDEDDPRYWRRASEAETADEAAIVSNGAGRIGNHLAAPEECMERQVWAADKLEEWLNEHTTDGSWTWEDGELFLLDDRSMTCDKCGRVGNREDFCFIGEECPMEDCDGTILGWAP